MKIYSVEINNSLESESKSENEIIEYNKKVT